MPEHRIVRRVQCTAVMEPGRWCSYGPPNEILKKPAVRLSHVWHLWSGGPIDWCTLLRGVGAKRLNITRVDAGE